MTNDETRRNDEIRRPEAALEGLQRVKEVAADVRSRKSDASSPQESASLPRRLPASSFLDRTKAGIADFGLRISFGIRHLSFGFDPSGRSRRAESGSNLHLPRCVIFVTHGPHALTHSASRVFLFARLGSPC